MRTFAPLLLVAAAYGNPASEVAELGGEVLRDPAGAIVEISLARTDATDQLIAQLAQIKTLRRLDLSFTYVTDRGIESLQQLPHLEELTLDTAEFNTDAALGYLRANKSLRKLVLRGTDVTDVGMPHVATLAELRTLDLSHTMLGDVGIESLPALTRLEELNLGGSRVSGINLHMLKLLPNLRKLSLRGIQRRNASACWTATITDLDLDTIAALKNLEELDLGVGIGLGRAGSPNGEVNCRATGGVRITDLGLAKLAALTKLRRLNLSGAKITAAGLARLQELPKLERLDLWYCQLLDDRAADILARMPALKFLDIADTAIGTEAVSRLRARPGLKLLAEGRPRP